LAAEGSDHSPKKQKKINQPHYLCIKEGRKINIKIFIGMTFDKVVPNPENLIPNQDNFTMTVTSRSWKLEGYLKCDIPDDAVVHGTLPLHFLVEGSFDRPMEVAAPLEVSNGMLTLEMKEMEERPFP
jgi:hypothetical protein